jgi:hypothetical protein
MAISFPSNPTVGQQYTAASITWEWNGSSWESLPPSPGIGLTNLSVTQSAVGTAALSYDNSSGVFSYTPPDLSNYLTAESDTLSSVTSRGSTTSETISFSASKGISMDTASNNPFQIYGSSNQKAYISHAQNGGAGGAGDLVVIAKNGLHVYGGTSENTANLGLQVTSGTSNLFYQGNSKLTTTNNGINVTGHTETDTLNVSGMTTFTMGYYGSGSEIRFLSDTNPGGSLSISHPSGNPYGVYMRFSSHDGDTATIETDSNSNMTIDAGANVHLRVNGDSVLSGTENSTTRLYYSNSEKLQTTTSGIQVTGGVQVGSGQSFGSNTGSAAVYYGDGSNLTGVGGGGASSINGLTDVTITSPSSGQVLKYNGSVWVNDTDATGGGGGGSLSSRSTVSGTTGVVGAASTTNLSITGFKSYGLLKIGTSAASWVRLYVDDASRTSDANRSYLEDPLPGSGLIAEVRSVSSGSNDFIMTPGIIGWNNDSTPGSTIYLSVTNNETGASSVTVDLTVVKLEN